MDDSVVALNILRKLVRTPNDEGMFKEMYVYPPRMVTSDRRAELGLDGGISITDDEVALLLRLGYPLDRIFGSGKDAFLHTVGFGRSDYPQG